MNDREKMTELVKILDAKKAVRIAAIDVESSTIIASYFVIASGGSLTQVNALADEAQEKMAEKGVPAVKVEGKNGGGWILIDFGGVILHLFTSQMREFYDLERLWTDAPTVDISGLLTDN
ncbi:MAG: ribosome silencing factor [Clostridia bacterium]